jgi:hypothetical protein
MSSLVRSSLERQSSERDSIDDIPVHSALLQAEEHTLRNSLSNDSGNGNFAEDLEMEDPLSRVYVRDEFEPFSRWEIGFISVSCVGVVLVPTLFLLSQVTVGSF